MIEDGGSATEIDPTDLQRRQLHGLVYDRTIADECPLCAYERAERVIRSRHGLYAG